MAKSSFATKAPLSRKDRRAAMFGWGVGALVTVGAYAGALNYLPTQPSFPLTASLMGGGETLITGSIGEPTGPQVLAQERTLRRDVQSQIDTLTLEMADLREALAAAQASGFSTNRRLEAIEQGLSLMTASVDREPPRMADIVDQPLPSPLSAGRDAGVGDAVSQDAADAGDQEPRIVLPSPTDGGAVAVNMRPLATDEGDGAVDESAAESALSDDDPAAADSATEAIAGDALLDDPLAQADDESRDETGDETSSEAGTVLAVSQTPFAVDLGGGPSLEAIDALWLVRREEFGAALDGLSPRILLQQTSEGALDLRLVAGPIQDAADAAMLCAQLVAAGLERCLPAVFDGQQLALR